MSEKPSAKRAQQPSERPRTGALGGARAGGDSGHLVVFDTTLRDGEQSPGISLDVAEKLEIAEQLARAGVDYIEAGFPVASQGDFEAVQAIARSVGNAADAPAICGLSRTQLSDVDRCWEAVRDAGRARIHVFISTSPQHMEHMLKMTEAQVLAETRGGVARAREHTDDVEFSPQDATRTPLDFMLEVLAASVEAGATTLNIPDTVGYGIPWDFGALIQHVRKEVPGDYMLSTHCHNDLGLATANTLAGVQAGARQVEVCVNGLGERAGNAALEEVVMALRIRPDQFPGITTTVRTEELARASRLVVATDRVPGPVQQGGRGPQRLRPRVGHPPARGPGRPLDLRDHRRGQRRPGGTPDRHGQALGPPCLRRHAREDGHPRPGRRAQPGLRPLQGVRRPQGRDHRGRPRGHRGRGARPGPARGLPSRGLEVAGGTVGMPRARVVVSRAGDKVEASAEGNGMIDAACTAIRTATSVDSRLIGFNVSSVTGGIDALGDVVVQLEDQGLKVSGRGVSTDVVEASARAYLAAVNRLVRIRARNDERELEIGP